MPQTITPVITAAGLAAAINAASNGLSIALTHMTLGAGQYAPAVNGSGEATQVDLLSRREKIAFGEGRRTAPKQVTLGAAFPVYSGIAYSAGEVGFWAGDPDNGGILFAVYSAPGYVHAFRNDQTELIESYSFAIAKIPEGSVSVTVDPNVTAVALLVADHEAKPDPHSQYFLRAEIPALRLGILQLVYPVGSVYITYDNAASPSTLFGFGNWQLTAIGRMFIGQDAGDAAFDTVGEQGGAKTITLDASHIPPHDHRPANTVNGTGYGFIPVSIAGQDKTPTNFDTTGSGGELNIADPPIAPVAFGGGQAHDNMPPYEVVRKWRRLPDTAAPAPSFVFFPQSNVPVNGVVTSNTVSVSGLAAPRTIGASGADIIVSGSPTVGNALFSVNGAGFATTVRTLNNGDTLALRLTAPAANLTTASVTMTGSDFSSVWSVTSAAAAGSDLVPDPFSFTPVDNAVQSIVYTSAPVTISGINAPSPISVTGGAYSINGGPFTTAAGTVTNGSAVRAQVTSASGPNASTTARITIGGVAASYTVTTQASTVVVVTASPSSLSATRDTSGGSGSITQVAGLTITGSTGPYTTSVALLTNLGNGTLISPSVLSPTQVRFFSSGSGNQTYRAIFRITSTSATGVVGTRDIEVTHNYLIAP